MRKMTLCLSLLLLVFSCDINNWDDTVIENTSAFPVTFKFSNTGQIVLPAGEQTTFPTEAYQRLESYTPDKRVYFTYSSTNDGYLGWFHSRESWTVRVINGIKEMATLSAADGWMDDIEDIPYDSVDDPVYEGKVYTDKPNFIVTKTESNFPAVAVYNRDPDGTFKVTIQWSN